MVQIHSPRFFPTTTYADAPEALEATVSVFVSVVLEKAVARRATASFLWEAAWWA